MTIPSAATAPAAGISLTAADFDTLAGILAATPEFRTAQGRLDFLDDVFAGSPRRADVLALLNLDGAPRGVAVRVISRLTQFGQDEPGRETLGILINKLLGSYAGGGADADFLRDLFTRYPLKTEPVAGRPVDDWRGHESPEDVQEKIIGENTLRDLRILELALEASPAVVHITTATQLGSGFLAGPGLVMTCHHVIHTPEEARDCLFTFNYQLDRAGNPAPVRTAGLKTGGLFYTNTALDFTVVEIDAVPEGVAPLRLARLRLQRDERVNIIQHPGGHYKKVSLTNNFVAYADARDLQYLTSTLPGSSGSPIFDDDNFLVVGIHHSGGQLQEPGTAGKLFGRFYLRNAGSSLIAVLDDLQAHVPVIYERLNLG